MNHNTIVFAAALLTAAGSVQAGQGVFHDTARVVHVDPIVSWREVPVERRVCKSRKHKNRHGDRYGDNYSGSRGDGNGSDGDFLIPTVLGGVVGGVLGSQVDDRGARVVATAAGSAAGSLLGYGLSQAGHDRPNHGHRRHKRCRTVTEYERRRHVDGYRVTYRYHGHEFTTRTEAHPGRRIPVRVKLRPEL